jgi:hypothetical protein
VKSAGSGRRTKTEKQNKKTSRQMKGKHMKRKNEKGTDATLDVAAVKTAAAALNELLRKLTFIRPMAPAEREKLKTVGVPRLRLAERRVQVARQHPEVLPTGFDVAQFELDLAIGHGLLECVSTVDKIRRGLGETLLLVGNRAARRGAEAYGYIKAAAVSSTNLMAAAEELARTGPRRVRATPPPTPTPPRPADSPPSAPGPAESRPSPSTPEVKAA